MSSTPQGSLRLLTLQDLETPLVGWQSTQNGLGLCQPRGWALLRVVVQKQTGEVLKDLYDQPMIVEDPGAIVVCQSGNRIGLVQNLRFTGSRLADVAQGYVRQLYQQNGWSELVRHLGQLKWECPRGLAPATGTTNLSEAFLRVAEFMATWLTKPQTSQKTWSS